MANRCFGKETSLAMQASPVHCSMMKMKTAMVLAAVSGLISGCAQTKSQVDRIQNVSAQDPWYMIDGSAQFIQ
jgi:hypothetical protein